MSKVILELDTKQVENLVKSLSLQDKIKIAQSLNQETWQARFRNLLYRVDKRAKKHELLSDEKIMQIVKRVRKQNYAQSHH